MSLKLSPNITGIELRKITLPNEEISCSWPECRKIFFSLENMEKHLKVHTEGLHECIYCKRQFQHKHKLNRHIRIHTGEKPFACSVCSQSFSRPDHFKSHTRLHTGENHCFKCRICQKSLSTKGNLKAHMRTHTGEKPYDCEVCGRSFASSSYLTVHQRIHNEDKPYECTFCSKSFTQLSTLTTHMRIHTGERPFNCKICSKSFAQWSSFQRHMRKHTDKMPRAHSIGGKCNTSNRNEHTRKVDKSEAQNKPNNFKQQAKPMHKEDVGRPDEEFSMHARTTRMQIKYEKKNKGLSSLTCQVCHQVIPSLENLCRHNSLQHNLPKVVMPIMVIPGKIILRNFKI